MARGSIDRGRVRFPIHDNRTGAKYWVTLQKIEGGGSHSIVAQHVHVEAGGQAVVGDVRMGQRRMVWSRCLNNIPEARDQNRER